MQPVSSHTASPGLVDRPRARRAIELVPPFRAPGMNAVSAVFNDASLRALLNQLTLLTHAEA